MSGFELQELGDGKFAVLGDVTFKTAGDVLRASETPFEKHTQIEIDLSGVESTDSAGLSLLLEWITWANHTVREIRFTGMPDKIEAIARVTEVEELLKRGERWSGFIEAPES
ncbi:MAG: STAS domain-containing protein [Pseudomonadota bacterium]